MHSNGDFLGEVYFIFYINSTASQICLLINALSLPAKKIFFILRISSVVHLE